MRWLSYFRLPYRAGVGIMLLSKTNKVFIAKRIDMNSNYWQMPQGGIDRGETAEEAAFRELKEEIGTNNAQILAKTRKEYYYDFPVGLIKRIWNGKYRGQRQTWFLMKYLGKDEDFNLGGHMPEFSEWRWVEIPELLEIVVPFKRAVYEEVISEFYEIFKE